MFFKFKNTKKQSLQSLRRESTEFFQFLNALVLGVCSNETARELCKVRQIWDNASDHMEYMAAFHLLDGAAYLALEDASESVDKDSYKDIKKNYLYRKNRLLWAINKVLQESSKTKKSLVLHDDIEKAKSKLIIRYSHLIKPYAKS